MTAALAAQPLAVWGPRPLDVDGLEDLYQLRRTAFVQEHLEVDLEPAIADEVDYRPTPVCDLPDAGALAIRLVPAMLEVMAGLRPVSQVSRWFAPALRERIQSRHVTALRRGVRPIHPPRVRRVHVCTVALEAVEVSVVVAVHGRVRACALRLTGIDGRWLVTALEMA